MASPAKILFKAFGGIAALRRALAKLGPEHERSYTTIYRWNVSREKGGTDGEIPAKALASVRLAAKATGVKLPAFIPTLTTPVLPRGVEFGLLAVKPSQPEREITSRMIFEEDSRAFWSKYYEQDDLLGKFERVLGYDLGGVAVVEALSDRLTVFRRAVALQKMSGTIARLRKEIENSGAKVVVYANANEAVGFAVFHLRDLGAICVYRNTPPRRAAALAKRFCTDRAVRAIILPTAFGLQLYAAQEVVLLDVDWHPENVARALMHAIGGRLEGQAVRVRFVTLERSVDTAIQCVVRDATKKFLC